LGALRDFIQTGGTVAQALPITYRINYLRNNRPALMSFTTDFNKINKTEIPQIKNLTINFHTLAGNGSNKDGDTRASVSIHSTSGKQYAGWTQQGEDEFGENSDKPFALSIQEPLLIRDLAAARISFHVEPNGSDTWRFNYSLTGITTDGRNYSSGRNGCEISDEHKDREDALQVIDP
jgi:hypothetical protein